VELRTESPVAALERALAALDVEAMRREYLAQGELLILERWLPDEVVAPMLEELERARPRIHRNYIPNHKKGGSVSAYDLSEVAPTITALYRSPRLREVLSTIAGRELQLCPPTDPHACALYFYTEPGDHIGFHYDRSYYKGSRFTVLVGLIERSSSRLVCVPHKGDPEKERQLRLVTHPGTLVFFNGDALWHSISPLGEGEERVALTLEYVTDGRMNPLLRFVSNMKDAIAYFGFKAVFRRRR
jgi:alkylated DNA repair dioxygenase AlkB